jgi:hypothetical protein
MVGETSLEQPQKLPLRHWRGSGRDTGYGWTSGYHQDTCSVGQNTKEEIIPANWSICGHVPKIGIARHVELVTLRRGRVTWNTGTPADAAIDGIYCDRRTDLAVFMAGISHNFNVTEMLQCRFISVSLSTFHSLVTLLTLSFISLIIGLSALSLLLYFFLNMLLDFITSCIKHCSFDLLYRLFVCLFYVGRDGHGLC